MKKSSRSPSQPGTPMQYLVHFLEMALQTVYDDPQKTELSIQKALSLAKDLDAYLEESASVSESESFQHLIKTLKTQTQNTDWAALFEQGKTQKELNPIMITGAYEAKLLKMLIQLIKAQRILEIGMFTGYSALMMASSLPKEGYLITCEEEPFLIDFVQPFFDASDYGKHIQIRAGKALDTLKLLAEEKQTFDMIFIDANKAEYLDYYLAIKTGQLLAPNGLICVDNTLMKGMVYASKAKKTSPAKSIAKFNQIVSKDTTFEQIILPVRDGLSIIRKVT